MMPMDIHYAAFRQLAERCLETRSVFLVAIKSLAESPCSGRRRASVSWPSGRWPAAMASADFG